MAFKEHFYGDRDNPFIVFSHDGKNAWVSSLAGMPCGDNGLDDGPAQTRGMILISADGVRYEGEKIKLVSKGFKKSRAEFHWETDDGKIEIASVWSFDEKNEIIGRKDTLTNRAKKPVEIRRCLARLAFSHGKYEVLSQASRWSNEAQGRWLPVHTGDIVLKTKWGRTSEGGSPYACVREIDGATGAALHVVPVGNWMIRLSSRVNSNALPFLVVEAGMSDEDLALRLEPGEFFDTPEILWQRLPGGDPALAAPALHRHVNQRIEKKVKPRAPVIYNTWLNDYSTLLLDELRAQRAAAKNVGCEIFVVDAGWFGPGEGWYLRGDWREKTDAAFFGKMAGFADETRKAGMGFGLWMEPEAFMPGVPVREKHPEWFSGTRMNLHIKEAYNYQLGEISRLVSTYKLAYMKMDMNCELGYDESGGELSQYTLLWNRLLDELRKKHPDTFFENCSSGGMRLDLNTAEHFDAHFPTDTANLVDVIRITQGLALRFPPGRLLRWAVIRPLGAKISDTTTFRENSVLTPGGATWDVSERSALEFALCVADMGLLGFSGDLRGLSDEAKKRVRWHVDFYKKHRDMIPSAAFHLLTPVEPIQERAGWTAFQVQNGEENLVFVYHRGNDWQSARRIQLRELAPDAVYEVRREAFEPALRTSREYSGRELMLRGLECDMGRFQHGVHDGAIFSVERKK